MAMAASIAAVDRALARERAEAKGMPRRGRVGVARRIGMPISGQGRPFVPDIGMPIPGGMPNIGIPMLGAEDVAASLVGAVALLWRNLLVVRQ